MVIEMLLVPSAKQYYIFGKKVYPTFRWYVPGKKYIYQKFERLGLELQIIPVLYYIFLSK